MLKKTIIYLALALSVGCIKKQADIEELSFHLKNEKACEQLTICFKTQEVKMAIYSDREAEANNRPYFKTDRTLNSVEWQALIDYIVKANVEAWDKVYGDESKEGPRWRLEFKDSEGKIAYGYSGFGAQPDNFGDFLAVAEFVKYSSYGAFPWKYYQANRGNYISDDGEKVVFGPDQKGNVAVLTRIEGGYSEPTIYKSGEAMIIDEAMTYKEELPEIPIYLVIGESKLHLNKVFK